MARPVTDGSVRPYRVLVLLGRPGAGKGTQCQRLAETLEIPHISTGDILRDHVRLQTHWGRQLKTALDSGALVPDHAVLSMLVERVASPDCAGGFILDGYPRTRDQAAVLSDVLASVNAGVELRAIHLRVSDAAVLKRLAGRQVCPLCHTVYGATVKAPRLAGRCDVEGAALIIRNDDRPETAQERLRIFGEQIAAIIEHYAERLAILDIDGERSVELVTADILDAIAARGEDLPMPARPQVSR